MPKYKRSGKANQPVAGHFQPTLATSPDLVIELPPGPRTVEKVDVELFRDKDGVLRDRRITVTVSCGHVKQVGRQLDDDDLPVAGEQTICLRTVCRESMED